LPPEIIVRYAAATPGMAVADIGVGTGYFLLPIVEALNGDGVFTGVDCQEPMLQAWEEIIAASPHHTTLRAVLSPADQVALPDASQNLLLLGMVFHELPQRSAYIMELHRVLKSGGRVLIIDWRPLAPGCERTMGPPNAERIALPQAANELAAAGFRIEQQSEELENFWLLTARKE
jgi:ubiquinone/menaquinone biosynthesis C-methylase UbiE